MDSRHSLQKQSSVNSSEQNSQNVRKQEANQSDQISSGTFVYWNPQEQICQKVTQLIEIYSFSIG
jgi:hypothetical protein